MICRACVRVEALVDIIAGHAVAVITRAAVTDKATRGVDALGVWRAVVLIPGALVDVGAHKTIPLVARRALALESTGEVRAGRIWRARVEVWISALVDVDAFSDSVELEAIGAITVEPARGVGANRAGAARHRVTLALVDILAVLTIALEAGVATTGDLVSADHTGGVLITDAAGFSHASWPLAVAIIALAEVIRHAVGVEADGVTRADSSARHGAEQAPVQIQA